MGCVQQLSGSGRAAETIARFVDRLDFFSHHFADGDSQQTGLRPSAWQEVNLVASLQRAAERHIVLLVFLQEDDRVHRTLVMRTRTQLAIKGWARRLRIAEHGVSGPPVGVKDIAIATAEDSYLVVIRFIT
jgi:hypothetical protein